MSNAQGFCYQYYKLILARNVSLFGTFTLTKLFSSFYCDYNVNGDKSEWTPAKKWWYEWNSCLIFSITSNYSLCGKNMRRNEEKTLSFYKRYYFCVWLFSSPICQDLKDVWNVVWRVIALELEFWAPSLSPKRQWYKQFYNKQGICVFQQMIVHAK